MAEEVDQESKTEDPTPRRREEARRQGQVPFSAELVGSLVLLGGRGRADVPRAGRVGRHDRPLPPRPAAIFQPEFGTEDARELIAARARAGCSPRWPRSSASCWRSASRRAWRRSASRSTPRSCRPNFDKLNPANGRASGCSRSGQLVRGGLTILKVVALAVVAYLVLEGRAGVITSLSRDRLAGAAAAAWAVVLRLALYLAAAVAAVAVLDYFYQRRQFEQSLRMTKRGSEARAEGGGRRPDDQGPHPAARSASGQRAEDARRGAEGDGRGHQPDALRGGAAVRPRPRRRPGGGGEGQRGVRQADRGTGPRATASRCWNARRWPGRCTPA